MSNAFIDVGFSMDGHITGPGGGSRNPHGSPHVVKANGVDLCIQTRGNSEDPPILLIHGAAASMLGWPDELFEGLADAGRYVVRYDHRDTGQSVCYPPGAPTYNLRDLVRDAVGILDVLELERAHVVGISMGGGIAQVLGIEHSNRVSSLTLMATSPGGPDLSPPARTFLEFVHDHPEPDWSAPEAVIESTLDMMRVFSGDAETIDEARLRKMLERDIERTTVIPASMQTNHFMLDPGAPVRDRLGEIRVPTLVIQGERDPVFPLDHACALAREIPDAKLIILEGIGHLVPWQAGEVVLSAILELTSEVNHA